MKRILLIVTLIAVFISTGMHTYAADIVTSEEGNNDVSVLADIISVFEVTVPSVVALSDGDVTEFQIKGKGDIGKYEYLHISFPKTVTMKAEGRYDEKLKITTSSDRFTSEQLASNDGGIINCSLNSRVLPTGSWSGETTVTVSLKYMFYRIPDTIVYNYPYTTVVKSKTDGTVYLYNHQQPFYHYVAVSGGSGAYAYERLTSGNSSVAYKRYKENGTDWAQDGSASSFSPSSYGIELAKFEILYCNYDIMDGNTQDVLWKTKMCPEY